VTNDTAIPAAPLVDPTALNIAEKDALPKQKVNGDADKVICNVTRANGNTPKSTNRDFTHSAFIPGGAGVLTPNFDEHVPELPLAAFNLSQRTSAPYWAWLEVPGNETRLARFGRAMGGSQGWEEIALEALGGTSRPAPPAGIR
jgi:hypothetical protein